MTKHSAAIPTELTSGKGFDFEDLVGAWLATYMISSAHFISNESALLRSIHFQVGNKGWLFDDILIDFGDDKKKFQIALSVKSNKQFTAKKAPSDLVENLWKQHLSESPFEYDNHYLGIITYTLSDAAKNSLSSLLLKSEYLPEGELQENINNKMLSKDTCSLHKSFDCPVSLLDSANNAQLSTDKVLKRFKAFQCDFYDQTSTSYTQSIANIKLALQDPSAENAANVFEKICTLVKRYRVNGGVVTCQILTSYISSHYQLKSNPEYSADLTKIQVYSSYCMDRVHSSIGKQISLVRAEEVNKIRESISSEKISIILGESGSGKSALLKRFSTSHTKALWLESTLFECDSLHDVINRTLQLSNTWVDIAGEMNSKHSYIIIDGVDRLWKSSFFSTLNDFLRPLLSENSNVKILITCQQFHWQRVQYEMLKVGSAVGSAKTVTLSDIDQKDIDLLKKQFPQFTKVFASESVSRFLLKPKILDLFAKQPSKSLSRTNTWRSEVELINWYWESEISSSEQGALKERFLLKLSKYQAEHFQTAIQVSMFEVSELIALDALEKSQICYRKNGRIYFEHDIYSDWFKKITLANEVMSNPQFLHSCADNPQWHRAISLFGAELVQSSSEVAVWMRSIEEAIVSKNYLLADLLLESIIHPPKVQELLIEHWLFFTKNKAKLLKRLFNRILHTATRANERSLLLAKYFNISELDASLINRVPVWVMWPGVLQFIIAKQDELTDLAPKDIAKICKLWIDNTPNNFLYRKDLTEIALKIGWRALQHHQHYRRQDRWEGADHHDLSFYYEVTFSCASENISEVIRLAKCASGMSQPTEQLPPDPPQEPITDPEILKRFAELENSATLWGDEEDDLPLIRDGAIYTQDNTFQKLVLETKAFLGVMSLDPETAANIILANCIRNPGAKRGYSSFDKGYGLTERLMGLFPPFYRKTPFLELLTISPAQGIRVILRLTEIATAEWFNEEEKRREHLKQNMFDEGYPLSLNLPFNGIEKEFYGERRWMHACRNTTIVPQLLTCALMSLEKWLSDKLDNEEDISQDVENLLSNTNSMAIVGVCFQLAKRENSLLKGCLFNFLKCPWIYVYDLHHCLSDERHQMIGHGMRKSEHQYNEAKEWHLREYRKTELETIILRCLFHDKKFQMKVKTELLPALQNWLNHASEEEHHAYILKLRHQFELKNWTALKNNDGNIQLQFTAPQELALLQKKDEEYLTTKQLLLRIPFYCLNLLNSDGKINEIELGDIFNNVSEIKPNLIYTEEDALCLVRSQCAIAALIILKQNLLPSLYQEHKETCKNVLLQHSANPPPLEVRIAESNFEIEWDRFCAKALPQLLTEDSDNNHLRSAVMYICLGLYYEALGFLVTTFFTLREKLKEDFYRLLNVINSWAALRLRVRIATENNSWRKEPLTVEQLNLKIDSLANKFIDKTLPTILPKWSNLPKLFELYENGETDLSSFPNFYNKMDCHVVIYGYSWLPPLNEAKTTLEKHEWYSLYQQFSLVLWENLVCKLTPKKGIEGSPYKIDHWIIEKITATLPYCTKDEATRLWKPILSVGAPAEYWITDFLNNWFSQLMKADVDKEHFVAVWLDMFNFAKSSESWSSERQCWNKNGNIWQALLGLDSLTIKFVWDKEYSDCINSMHSEFKYYCEHRMPTYRLDKFAYFLISTSGKILAKDGINWIYQHLSKNKQPQLEESAQNAINTLITDILSSIRFNQLPDATRTAILGLLKLLADKQNVKSMELYRKLA